MDNISTTPNSTPLKGKHILLVEDNALNRLMAATVLNNYGAVVSEVVNGLEAIAAVKDHSCDLILMDIQMPLMDGREATRAIRNDINKEIPIIALTANASKGEMDICLAAGMNDYVTKPFKEEYLINVICRWLYI
jgi:CheY-like chemotaxis protein